MARQGTRTPEIRARRRPLRRRPAPGHRHRGARRRDRRRTDVGHRYVRGHRAHQWEDSDHPDGRRLFGDPDASRLDERATWTDDRRRGTRRDDRPERRGRARRPVRPPRHPALRGPERLRRSTPVPAGAACGAHRPESGGCGWRGAGSAPGGACSFSSACSGSFSPGWSGSGGFLAPTRGGGRSSVVDPDE